MTYRVAFVCLGNICRSPMAHVVVESKLAAAGLADQVTVTSSGTGDWHIGEPMDHRAAAILSTHGYDPSRHRARQFVRGHFDDNDLVLTMDRSNHANVSRLAATEAELAKIRMFREYDPEAESTTAEVPDPWYAGDESFAEVLQMVERTADQLVQQLRDSVNAG